MHDGIEYALNLAVGLSDEVVQGVTHEDHIHPQDAVGPTAAMFFVGLEMGMRLSINAGQQRTKAFLARLISEAGHPFAEPLEIRERQMKEDIDHMLGVAVLTASGDCPDCTSHDIQYDEGAWHLVCMGCGQLVREKSA